LLAHGRWFCPGTPASSTTKTGRHIAESGAKTPKIKSKSRTILLFEYNLLSYNFSSPSDIDEYTLLVWFLEIFYEYEV
jgi:hypothetical protein